MNKTTVAHESKSSSLHETQYKPSGGFLLLHDSDTLSCESHTAQIDDDDDGGGNDDDDDDDGGGEECSGEDYARCRAVKCAPRLIINSLFSLFLPEWR